MASISTQLLEDLVREAEVLSSIKADIPNTWKFLEHEIGRTRAAVLRSADASTASHTNSPPSEPITSNLHTPQPQTSAISTATTKHTVTPSSVSLPSVSVSASTANARSVSNSIPTSASLQFTPSSSIPASCTSVSSATSSSSSTAAQAAAAVAIAAFADVSHPPPPTAPRHPIRKRVKLPVPAEQYPDYNFVGRLLGPRGATLKRLERDTGCRIMIRGKGSIRKDKEAEVRGKPGYEHVFNEPLHVVIEVVDATDENTANQTLKRAKEFVEMLLIPVPEERDSLKRAQLRDLAILNGTHRSVADILNQPVVPTAPGVPMHHPTLNIPPARSPTPQLASSPPPVLRRSHSSVPKQSTQLYPSSDPYTAVFDPVISPFSRLPSQSGQAAANPGGAPLSSAPTHQRGVGPFATQSGTYLGNASASDSFLPDLSKLRIPSLDFEALNEPGLSSPLPMPLSSPTLVDPDMYPYPPTPSVLPLEQNSLNAFASPMWSTGRNGSSTGGGGNGGGGGSGTALSGMGGVGVGLPPRSPPPLPPRSPPPNCSAGTLPDMNGGINGGMNGGNGAGSFFLGRQMGDNGKMVNGGSFGRELGQRDYDNGFNVNTPLSSPRVGDDDLAAMGGMNGRGGYGMNGVNRLLSSPVGSPPLHTSNSHLQQMGSSPNIGLGLNTSSMRGHATQHGQQGQMVNETVGLKHDGFVDNNMMLSNLFPMSSCGDDGEQVSLRFHQAARQGQHVGPSNGASTVSK